MTSMGVYNFLNRGKLMYNGIMASFINLDRTEGQVESPESSARQFSRYLVIKETKGNETEKNWLPLLPNKISNNITDVLEKAIKNEIDKKTAGLKSIILKQEKIIAELILTLKQIDERNACQSWQDECTQTEALPLFPVKPTPPKEGVPRKNGRHHRRHQTYPLLQDRMPPSNHSQQDVGIQTVLPSNSKKGLPVLVKLESKGRRSNLQNDREPHTSEGLSPIAAGDLESPSFYHSPTGTLNVEMPAISCTFHLQDSFCIMAGQV